METGEAVVARANAHVRYPARFQLVAAMNPCRCGYLSDPAQACGRAPKCGADYQSRISGPLLDRIDLHVEVAGVSASDLALPPPAEGSAEVAARVARGARHPARALCRGWRPHQCGSRRRIAGPGGDAGCGGRQASHRSGGAHAADGARLSPRAAAWRAPSPTSPAPTPWQSRISPKRCPIAGSRIWPSCVRRSRLRLLGQE